MANTNHALLSLCLLLAVACALAAKPSEVASRRRLQRLPIDPNEPTDPLRRSNGPLGLGPIVPLPPAAVACWKSILASKDCVNDILESLAALELHVSKVCCSELEKIGDKCVIDAFSSFPFNPLFPPLVKHVCTLAA